jgi:hypothetical protein
MLMLAGFGAFVIPFAPTPWPIDARLGSLINNEVQTSVKFFVRPAEAGSEFKRGTGSRFHGNHVSCIPACNGSAPI